MQWQDDGILVDLKRYGEKKLLATLITKDHGLHKGILRETKAAGLLQHGDCVAASWRARLPEHLGTWTLELTASNFAFVLNERKKLAALTTICHYSLMMMPERDPNSQMYEVTKVALQSLDHDDWIKSYVEYEYALMRAQGVRLKLERCAVTGQTNDLTYISPRTGAAVCMAEGELYKDKLLPYPRIMDKEPINWNADDIAEALKVSGYFLENFALNPLEKALPVSRAKLL